MSSAKERLQKAFDETVQALASRDVPLLMHSAGDTLTPDPQTVQLVAALTVQYMGRLVDAALDAREILHPDIGRTIPPLPPPPLRPTHSHHAPSKRKKSHSEFWDDPLPTPKIRRREGEPPPAPAVDIHQDAHEWVGVAGVDLWEHRRARAVYTSHGALTRHQFMFPLCQDSYVYGRIRAVQAKKMAEFVPLLQDTVLHETVEAEGGLLQQQQREQHRRWRKQQAAADPHNPTKRNKQADGKSRRDEAGNSSDEEESDSDAESKSEEEGDGPSFPGMDTFLPAYRTFPTPN